MNMTADILTSYYTMVGFRVGGLLRGLGMERAWASMHGCSPWPGAFD